MFALYQYLMLFLIGVCILGFFIVRWWIRNSYISNNSKPYETENFYGKHAND